MYIEVATCPFNPIVLYTVFALVYKLFLFYLGRKVMSAKTRLLLAHKVVVTFLVPGKCRLKRLTVVLISVRLSPTVTLLPGRTIFTRRSFD